MGRIRKSDICATCRKRKIKCDGQVPECGPCQRAQRSCPGPSNDANFQDESARLRRTVGKDVVEYFHSIPEKSIWFPRDESVTNDGIFQKWHRLSALHIEPSLSPPERLGFQLMPCLEATDGGFYFDGLCPWLVGIPSRLGYSQALDDAAECMAMLPSSIKKKAHPDSWIDAATYGKAIKSIHLALDSAEERLSFHTLVACSMIWLLELYSRDKVGLNWLYHAGGISKLLEISGPGNYLAGFERQVVFQILGCVVSYSIFYGQPCFVSSSAWFPFWSRDVELPQKIPLVARPYYEIWQVLILWPGFAKDVQTYRASGSAAMKADLLLRLRKAEWTLRSIGTELEQLIAEGKSGHRVISRNGDPLVPNAIAFASDEIARVYAWHGTVVLLIDSMLAAIVAPTDFACNNTTTTAGNNSWYAYGIAEFLWQSFEHAWPLRPIGAMYMVSPLIMSFVYASTEEMRKWIIKSLNRLQEYRRPALASYTEQSVMASFRQYTGQKGPMVAAVSSSN